MANQAQIDSKFENYKNTLKSNLMFGGIKLFQVLIAIAKIKIVAVVLGPDGMGLQSLLASSLATIFQFTTFGIFQSAVRDISYNSGISENNTINIVKTLNTLSLATGLIGLAGCSILASPLSKFVIGNGDYASAFRLIGLALIFESLYNAKIATFQGLRKLKPLAKASMAGATAGVAISIPLYIYFREESIPFVLAINAAMFYLSYLYFGREFADVAPSSLAKGESLKIWGVPIVKLGMVLMCSNGIMTIYSLCLNSYINHVGSISDVGLYNGAVTCTYGNIIVLVSILSSDFYPRLSASIDDKSKFGQIVNQQLELLLLIAAPIISLLVVFPEFVVKLLLSNQYSHIASMISLMALSLIFRIIWHTFSFVILACGHRKTYFWFDAILGNGLVFVMNIAAYYRWGLDGLAYSYVCGAIIMVTILSILMCRKYELRLRNSVKLLSLGAIAVVTAEYILKQAAQDITIIPAILLLAICVTLSAIALNRRVGFLKRNPQ